MPPVFKSPMVSAGATMRHVCFSADRKGDLSFTACITCLRLGTPDKERESLPADEIQHLSSSSKHITFPFYLPFSSALSDVLPSSLPMCVSLALISPMIMWKVLSRLQRSRAHKAFSKARSKALSHSQVHILVYVSYKSIKNHEMFCSGADLAAWIGSPFSL